MLCSNFNLQLSWHCMTSETDFCPLQESFTLLWHRKSFYKQLSRKLATTSPIPSHYSFCISQPLKSSFYSYQSYYSTWPATTIRTATAPLLIVHTLHHWIVMINYKSYNNDVISDVSICYTLERVVTLHHVIVTCHYSRSLYLSDVIWWNVILMKIIHVNTFPYHIPVVSVVL